jgi:hypothetical protein
MILYINGQPYMRYDGPTVLEEIRKFIVEVSNILQQQIFQSKDDHKKLQKPIPGFTIGHPVYGDDGEYYMEYPKAYKK